MVEAPTGSTSSYAFRAASCKASESAPALTIDGLDGVVASAAALPRRVQRPPSSSSHAFRSMPWRSAHSSASRWPASSNAFFSSTTPGSGLDATRSGLRSAGVAGLVGVVF